MDTLRYLILTILMGPLLVLGGCSSISWMSFSDPPKEVTGTYEIRTFEFAPEASALETTNVLGYLTDDGATLELTNSKDFVLRYRIEDGEQVTLTGTYSVEPKKIVFNGQREDRNLYEEILLDREFYLLRKGKNRLWVDSKKNVALGQLSTTYDGLTGVDGVLRVEFVREKSPAVSDR